MKTVLYLFIIVFLFSCSTEDSRTSEQPEAVQNAFKSQYADVKKAKWEKDGDTYTVEFEIDGMETEVTYDKNGNVLVLEEEISSSELPAGALSYIAENHPEGEIEEAEKIEKDSNVYFAAEIEEDGEEIELLFDDGGNYLGLEPDDGDDGEEEENEEENEVEIDIDDLPGAIKNTILENYPGAEFMEADKITREDGTITYDVEIKVVEEVLEVMYDVDGNFLGIETDEDEDED